MFEVTFWKNGREMTMPDEFETFEHALEFARENVNYRLFGKFQYDEAHVFHSEDDNVYEVVERVA